MLKKFTLADQEYDKAAILSLKDGLIPLRDAALEGSMMSWAIILTHTIGVLSYTAMNMEA